MCVCVGSPGSPLRKLILHELTAHQGPVWFERHVLNMATPFIPEVLCPSII